jgi:hydrogenase 3 maturation protease
MGQDMSLRAQLENALRGRVCLIGAGNTEYSDDGLGVRLAEELRDAGLEDVIVAGANLESFIGAITGRLFDHVVFLDAVEFGGEPGSVVFLDAREINTRFPQVSTHKISLGLLAQLIESNGISRAWLLGVQPESVKTGQGLSPKIRATLDGLRELLFA